MSTIARGFVLVAVLVVGMLGAAVYVSSLQSHSSGSSTSITSTTSTPCTSISWSGTTSTTSTHATSTVLNGSFTAFPTSPVKVDAVQAVVAPAGSLSFRVGFTNVGLGTVYVAAGCGGSLNSTITSGDDVVKTTSVGVRCLCPEYMAPVGAGQSHTSVDPGCWSPYGYLVEKPGSFSASFTLSWFESSQPSGSSGHLTITATFAVP